jgi:FdhE protein
MCELPDNETLTHLKAARARRPELAPTLDLHIAILDARGKAQITTYQLQIQIDEARSRLERGEPLLRVDELALDWDALARLFREICRIAAEHQPEHRAAFAELAIKGDQPARIEKLAREYLVNTQHALRTASQSPSSNPQSPLLAFALNNALHPFLAAHGRAMRKFVDAASWYRAYCPICGGEADFAALEKESGARRLLCARCDFEWTFQRSVCPFCSEDAPGKWSYFPSDDGASRLYVCETCKRYLKTIDVRELFREVNLPAERVLTIGMDVMAPNAGYHSG